MQKLRKNDPVKVIAGKYKGTISTITKRIGDLVVVNGVNVQKRAKKGEGYVEITKPIHISNVMYYDKASNTASRVTISVDSNKGTKQRTLIKNKAVLA